MEKHLFSTKRISKRKFSFMELLSADINVFVYKYITLTLILRFHFYELIKHGYRLVGCV